MDGSATDRGRRSRPTARQVPDCRATTETSAHIADTVGIDSPRSILNAAPSTGFIMCVRSDGGGLRAGTRQTSRMRAFAGSAASASAGPATSSRSTPRTVVQQYRRRATNPAAIRQNWLLDGCMEPPLRRAQPSHGLLVGDLDQNKYVAGCARQ